MNVDTLLSCRLGPRSSRERRNCSTLFTMAKVTGWKEWPAKLYSDRKSRGIIPCFLPSLLPSLPLSLSSTKNRCKIRSTNSAIATVQWRNDPLSNTREPSCRGAVQYLSYLNNWHTILIKKLDRSYGRISLFDKVKRRWRKWWQFINNPCMLLKISEIEIEFCLKAKSSILKFNWE